MINRIGSKAIAALLCAVLSGCVVTPVAYRPAPPPPPAPPPEPAAYTNEAQATEPPPPLPVYEQPPCPQVGYLWTPGYWHWGPAGYFWVPGTWVAPPAVGVLWTPGYWAMTGAVFVFHAGYWGPHVGYYGGVNYGAGYSGDGFHGGRWVNNRFQYNTSVTNVNVVNVHNTYNETVVNNVTVNSNRTSYVGGGNARVQQTASETAAAREPHYQATPAQIQHHVEARSEPSLNAQRNEGRPPIAATPHPGALREPGATAAKQAGPAWHPQHPQPQKDENKGEPRG
jgi:WXXGXW repeat (2 copies)